MDVEQPVARLLTWFQEYGPWATLGLVVLGLWLYRSWRSLVEPPESKNYQNLKRFVEEDTLFGGYFEKLDAALDKVSGWVGDSKAFPDSPGGLWLPLTPESFGFSLRLGIAYPLVSLLFLWFSTTPGALGDFLVLPAEPRVAVRFGTLLLFVGGCYAWWRYLRAEGRRATLLWLAVAIGVSYAGSFDWVLAVAVIGAVAVAGSVAGAGAVPAVGAVAVAIAAAGAGAVSAAFADGAAWAFSYGVSDVLAWALAFLIGFAFVFGSAVACAAAFAFLFLQRKSVYKRLLGLAAGYAVAVMTCAFSVSSWEAERIGLLLVVFLVCLPFVNAPIDWLSLAVTRGLLHRLRVGLHSPFRALGWALLDLVVALLLFFMMVLVVAAALAYANALRDSGVVSATLVHLNTLIRGLRTHPGAPEYRWLYLMVLTPLVPTVVHFVLAGVAGGAVLTAFRRRALEHFEHPGVRETAARLWAFGYVTFAPLASLLLIPGVLFWLLLELLSLDGAWLGYAILDASEWVACAIDPFMGCWLN